MGNSQTHYTDMHPCPGLRQVEVLQCGLVAKLSNQHPGERISFSKDNALLHLTDRCRLIQSASCPPTHHHLHAPAQRI